MTETSRFISLILRHKPEAIGITLDEHGWAQVSELLAGLGKTERHRLSLSELEELVRLDSKGRYSFNQDHTLIRANQGHSIPVDVELEETLPPEILWHGTGQKSASSIQEMGLLPMSRLYVHLSGDQETARRVGARHGKPVLFEVDCKRMAEDGYAFFLSANKVWLTKKVPPKYLKRLPS